jgi:CDP-glycerol glycerophosphotransferase (TagB/SpsB family)
LKKVQLKKRKFGILFDILLLPIYYVISAVPKKSNLVILGSSQGFHFADNSKYLYIYMKENSYVNSHLEFFWLTKNKILYQNFLKNGDKHFLYLYSIRGIYYLIRARYAFITHSVNDLIPIFLGGKEVCQLWHGVPLKNIVFDADNWGEDNLKNKLKMFIYNTLPYTNYAYCTKLFVSSEFIKDKFISAFRIKESQIVITGQPRNQFLVDDNAFVHPTTKLKLTDIQKFENVIMWMPTHRGFSNKTIKDLLLDYDFNISNFNSFLKEKNYLFVIKPHFVEKGSVELFTNGYSNIITYNEADPYPLLKKSDLLITDYSSVLFDYLLLDKPAIFTPFDFEEYTKNIAGLYFNYEDISYGPICKNWIEVQDKISTILGKDEEPIFRKKREKMQRNFTPFDSVSNKLICEYLLSND